MVRRSIAVGAGILALVLLLLLLRSCADSRQEQAFRDYTREVAALAGESDDQSAGVFRLLTDPGDAGEVEIETQLNAFASNADDLVGRVRDTDHPDELAEAHDYLVETFAFRRDGVKQIARLLPPAISDRQQRADATNNIAAAMQNFLASDVIYTTRFGPRLKAGLEEQQLDGEIDPHESRYLPDPGWLDPASVADRVQPLGGAGGGASGDAAPGLHGNSVVSVTVGGVALTADGSATVALSGDVAFEVQVSNQGENTEADVQVNVTVGEGGDSVALNETLEEIAAGETATVPVPFDGDPPTGQEVPITVEVEPVPGEDKTDNNTAEYSVIFTR